MIDSLLELIGALFLASLPLYLLVMRSRRRRRAARMQYTQESDRRSDVLRGRRVGHGADRFSQISSNFPAGGEYRPLVEASVSSGTTEAASLKRFDRYPPLQRAIVMKEILGRPKGIDDISDPTRY